MFRTQCPKNAGNILQSISCLPSCLHAWVGAAAAEDHERVSYIAYHILLAWEKNQKSKFKIQNSKFKSMASTECVLLLHHHKVKNM